ncbi:hypothetical protein ACFUOZ_05800 [Paenarthrobacter sp. NPDC057355]|uniref:hypothetical protein n=1 Tax=Paenarthrobacter sp. NPDC057355 TaxID=3346105 RepID=UPI00363F7152
MLSTLLSIVAIGLSAGCGVAAQPAAPETMSFGVLGASCAPERVVALREAGVSVVELPLAWDRYEPGEGLVDERYVAGVRAQLQDCRDAGMAVVLSPGLHYPPDWVRSLPGGVLRGSAGGVPGDSGAELVFSAKVREAVHEYLARIASDVGFEGIAAIRVGTNATGELGYPGAEDGGNEREFWSFGDAPQLGKGLAEGVAPSPMPGWVPGARLWKGRAVNSQQVQAWWDWYAGAVVGAVVWQVDELRGLGYQGRVHVPVAGKGVLPAEKTEALRGRLDGRANPDGAQERGLDYLEQFAVLSTLPGVDVDFTGLDDISAVTARAVSPLQDRCHPGDEVSFMEDDVSVWSSHRYTSALARRAGLGLVGENPGAPWLPYTGGTPLSDSLAEQLQIAPRYAAECGMTMFLFGFEDDLFDPEGRSGVTLDHYSDVIQSY